MSEQPVYITANSVVGALYTGQLCPLVVVCPQRSFECPNPQFPHEACLTALSWWEPMS